MFKNKLCYLSCVFIILFYTSISSKILAEEYVVESTGRDTVSESITTSKGDTKVIRKIEGTWTDNLGDYGVAECIGTIDSNNNKVFLDLLCENTNQDKEKSWSLVYRKYTSEDSAIGVVEYIDASQKYKYLIGKKCNYAIKFYEKKVFFFKQKCLLN